MTLVALVGLCTVDLIQRVRNLPTPGEKVQSLTVEVAAGGPAANAAVAVVALGGRARLVTALGAHPLARLAAADLTTHGVAVVDTEPGRQSPPPISAVTVRTSDGERTVVSHNAEGMSPSKLDTDLRDARALLVDGHHPALALAAARAAREAGVPVVLDAGSWKPVMVELLQYVDVVAASAGFVPEIPLTVPIQIVTNGPHPVRWSANSTTGEVNARRVEPRNTAGAGDVWHGALALAIAEGGLPSTTELPEMIGYANTAAATKIQHEGARSWVRSMPNGTR